MIIVKNRTLLFANREQYLGTSYDNNSAVRIFQVPRISIDGVDIANLTFVANLKKSNGAKVSSYLEKEIRDEEIILVWEIKNEALNPAGTMFLNLRATDSNGTVRWSTYPAVVYAEGSIDAPEVSGDAVLGFEQMVARSEELIMELEESEGERVEAEQFREEAEEERASRAEALYGQLGDAIRSADEAAAKANAAAGRLDEVGEAIDSANEAAAAAVQAAENANVAAGVANSASQTATEAKAAAESASQTATEAKAAAGNTATEVSSLRTEVAQQKDALTKYLPLTGGQLSGNTTIVSGTMPQFALKAGTSKFVMLKNANADGSVEDGTHLKDYPNNNDGTTFAGIILKASNDLKYNVSLHKSVSGNASAYNLFGEHNKPSGSYTGNGSATARTISIGGLNTYELLYVVCPYNGTHVLVGIGGGIGWNGKNVYAFNYDETHFQNGEFYVASTHIALNQNSTSYGWRVL